MGGRSPNQDDRQADGRDVKGVAGQKTPAGRPNRRETPASGTLTRPSGLALTA